MQIKRMQPGSYPFELTPLQTRGVTNIWANDGWCYVPELQVRRKFRMMYEDDVFDIQEETWAGVIPLSEYSESVTWTLYSQSPRVWKEQGQGFCELYVETSQTQSKSKKTRAHPPAQQSQT
jgi:hypothetical protein